MGDFDDFDLDRTTARAWSRFQGELADHVVAMDDDDILVVEVDSAVDDDAEGAAPYVQLCAWGGDKVRAEVASNAYLAAEVALGPNAEAMLLDQGWEAPTYGGHDEPDAGSANFWIDLARREGDRLAAMAVAALREVFGVPHPAFLDWPGAEDGEARGAARAAEDDDEPDETLAVMPGSPERLRSLVAEALTAPGGPDIAFDDDGDIPLPVGSALLFVRVVEVAPVVEIFSFVVRGDLDRERAAFEVAVLNRDTRMVKFVLLDDAVLATVQLPAAPFAPRHLRSTVLAMADIVDRVDEDLAARIGGRRGLDPEPEAQVEEPETQSERRSLHPALQTLLELDAHGRGDIDPELAASVCEFDRDLVLVLLREASQQEITWRRSGNDALMAEDPEEAEVCFVESRGWRATVETLRKALREVVERQRAEAVRRSRPRHDPQRRGSRGARQQSLLDDAPLRRDSTGQDTLFRPEPD